MCQAPNTLTNFSSVPKIFNDNSPDKSCIKQSLSQDPQQIQTKQSIPACIDPTEGQQKSTRNIANARNTLSTIHKTSKGGFPGDNFIHEDTSSNLSNFQSNHIQDTTNRIKLRSVERQREDLINLLESIKKEGMNAIAQKQDYIDQLLVYVRQIDNERVQGLQNQLQDLYNKNEQLKQDIRQLQNEFNDYKKKWERQIEKRNEEIMYHQECIGDLIKEINLRVQACDQLKRYTQELVHQHQQQLQRLREQKDDLTSLPISRSFDQNFNSAAINAQIESFRMNYPQFLQRMQARHIRQKLDLQNQNNNLQTIIDKLSIFHREEPRKTSMRSFHVQLPNFKQDHQQLINNYSGDFAILKNNKTQYQNFNYLSKEVKLNISKKKSQNDNNSYVPSQLSEVHKIILSDDISQNSKSFQFPQIFRKEDNSSTYISNLQQIELQELQQQRVSSNGELQQQRVSSNGELQRNYEQSLRQIAELKQVNVKLVGELRTAKEQLQSIDMQKSRQLLLMREQLDRRNAAFTQLQGKSRESSVRWETERKQFQQRLQTLGKENKQAQQHSLDLQNQNRNLKSQTQRLAMEASKNGQLSHTIGEYQNRFQILAEEIDRLNSVLHQRIQRQAQAKQRQMIDNQIQQIKQTKNAQTQYQQKQKRKDSVQVQCQLILMENISVQSDIKTEQEDKYIECNLFIEEKETSNSYIIKQKKSYYIFPIITGVLTGAAFSYLLIEATKNDSLSLSQKHQFICSTETFINPKVKFYGANIMPNYLLRSLMLIEYFCYQKEWNIDKKFFQFLPQKRLQIANK